MGIPKPRREGQSGGMRHRSNYRAFGNSGGSVRPPSKGCLGAFLLIVAVPLALVAAGVGVFVA